MTRRTLMKAGSIATTGAALASTSCATTNTTEETSAAKRPNILWICTDAQRWDTLGCYDNDFVKTPAADQLATEGMLFEHAYVQNPLCQPSRAAFLTGRYPVTVGLTKNGQDIKDDAVLITQLLAESGYVCGLSGKLHLKACDNRIKDYGEEWWRYENKTDFDMREPRINDGYTDFHWDHAPNGSPLSDYTRWVEAKGGKVQYTNREDCKHVQRGMPSDLHQTKWTADVAIDFIERNQDENWCFSLNCFAPHYPFNPSDEYLERYLPNLDQIPLPNWRKGEWDEKSSYEEAYATREWIKYPALEMTDNDHRMLRAAYWAMCDQVDDQVARVLQALDESGQRDNTIVIFMSDHGELLGDHGIYTKDAFLYDPCVRVPLIIRWPGKIEAGVRSKALVEITDLAPTLLEAAGLERHPGMQARSMIPLLTGQTDPQTFRDDVYCEYYDSNPDDPPQYRTMIRTEKWKLIANHGDSPSQLYDMENDPLEQENLWNKPEVAKIQAELYQRLCDRMAFTVDPIPPRVGLY